MKIPPERLAWMAAILDIQGRTSHKNNQMRATPQLVLRVESSQLSVIKRLSEMTGQAIERRPQLRGKSWDRRPCVEHCDEPHIHVDLDTQPVIARWSVTGAAAAVVLYNVIPYMVTDRGMTALMEEALEYANLQGRSGNSARQAVARLASMGWKLPPKIRTQRRLLGAA